MVAKNSELADYRSKFGIKIVNESELNEAMSRQTPTDSSAKESIAAKTSSSGVLVAADH